MNKYKKNIREMFFTSVEKDLNLWTTTNPYYGYCSPNYNDFKLNIVFIGSGSDVNDNKRLYLCNSTQREEILRYGIFRDFKVFKYVRKIKKYFKQKEEEKNYTIENSFLSSGLEEIEKHYVKDIRKKKLEEINK